ncbi:hypothetical protein H4Q32_005530 [Labeo rohita]|uniref:LITAF domain-containing protein n=1 Tax=Labeo rohita TaxID=84645 RepID=A0ABQ8N0Z3_LABRO|nr:hypothetical protein H4Q32_005530 [Labeo rohita]
MQQIVNPVAPQVVVVQPQQMVVLLDDTPTATVCKYCHRSIITNVKYKAGSAAWGMCFLLTVLGGFKDAHHSCPYCQAFRNRGDSRIYILGGLRPQPPEGEGGLYLCCNKGIHG